MPPAPIEELKKHFPHLDTSHKSSIPLPSGIETVQACHGRVEQGLDALISQLDAEGESGPSTILLAGHAASVICAVRALLQDESFPVRCGTASLSKLERQDDGSWKLVIHGDCSHLSKGEQRSWAFSGDIPDYEKQKMVEGSAH